MSALSRNSGFGPILDHFGALKMPFLAHTGRKSEPLRDATASPSCKLSSWKRGCFAQRFACHRSNLPSIRSNLPSIKEPTRSWPYDLSQKSYPSQVLRRPERIPQFTVIGPAASTTIDRDAGRNTTLTCARCRARRRYKYGTRYSRSPAPTAMVFVRTRAPGHLLLPSVNPSAVRCSRV